MQRKKSAAERAEKEYQRLLARLEAVLPVYAWKRQAGLGEAIGRGKNFVWNVLRGKATLTLRDFLKLLAAMDVELEKFASKSGGELSIDCFLATLERRTRGEVQNVQRVLARPAAEAWGRGRLRAEVESLEELRFTDRERAQKRAIEVLRQGHPARFRCEAFRVLGVIARARGKHTAAAYNLRQALELGRRHQRVRAHALLSVSCLAMDQGEYQLAHTAVHQASAIYRGIPDLPGIGRSLVESGRIYGEQRKLRQSRPAFEGGLQLLPRNDWLCRYTALHGLGLVDVYANVLGSATVHLSEALEILHGHEAPELEAWALWLRGEVLLKEGAVEAAGRVFGTLQAKYLMSGDLDNALHMSLRVCKVLHRGGRTRELATFATGMATLLAPLERESVRLAAALQQLITAAASGRLTDVGLDACYRAVSKVRGASVAETPLTQALVSWREL